MELATTLGLWLARLGDGLPDTMPLEVGLLLAWLLGALGTGLLLGDPLTIALGLTLLLGLATWCSLQLLYKGKV